MVVVIGAGEAGRGGERPVPDGEVALAQAHVVVNVAGGRAAADHQERQGPGCRICHLPDGDGELPERLRGRLVRLGCGCRGELAAAHRRCAEAWFSVRGNRRCEICGENAVNITGGGGGKEFIRQWHDTAAAVDGGGLSKACGGFCRNQSFCNLLIALLIVVFLLTWFFHNHIHMV
ncbi:hypothetical protein SEVIR_3G075800v4 [Setaria viridis]|uniref:RING-CH-type domain-containing protein n=1 Tax=Setaria viridis TaxID=4556 RepID=A0A4U6VCE9_SETVI|nr:uncharacterized protein LOC117850187 [Setaria viridis]TKW24829.1 hypothetical protein SEVIR_3G075800v2 [Setaria viridis]